MTCVLKLPLTLICSCWKVWTPSRLYLKLVCAYTETPVLHGAKLFSALLDAQKPRVLKVPGVTGSSVHACTKHIKQCFPCRMFATGWKLITDFPVHTPCLLMENTDLCFSPIAAMNKKIKKLCFFAFHWWTKKAYLALFVLKVMPEIDQRLSTCSSCVR